MRPELSVPHSLVRMLAAGILALAAVLALAYLILFTWQRISPQDDDVAAAKTEQEKLDILAGLSGTTSLSADERAAMLETMSGDSRVSEAEKEAILEGLRKR